MSLWHPPIATLTVDIVVFTVRNASLHVLLVKRAFEPYAGFLALPGGFVSDHEEAVDTAARELAEETRISPEAIHFEQLGAYSSPGRDPRGRIVSIAFLAISPNLPVPTAGVGAAEAFWVPASELESAMSALAFDHSQIVLDGIEQARSRLESTTLALAFCNEVFTMAELRQVYEAFWGARLDRRNFQRKVLSTHGFIILTDQLRTGELGRPARLYTRGPATVLYPPILRATTPD